MTMPNKFGLIMVVGVIALGVLVFSQITQANPPSRFSLSDARIERPNTIESDNGRYRIRGRFTNVHGGGTLLEGSRFQMIGRMAKADPAECVATSPPGEIFANGFE